MSFSLMSCSSYGDKLSNYRAPKPIQLPYKSSLAVHRDYEITSLRQ